MDRLLLKRCLIAASGLALMMAASGCRDRNLNVPPPAHYTDGAQAIPEAVPYSGASPLSSAPSAMDPYAGASLGAPRSFDPATTQTSGVTGAIGNSYGTSATPTYDPQAGYGVPQVPGGTAPAYAGGTFASPSSPPSYVADSYTSGGATTAFPGMNSGAATSIGMPPIESPEAPALPTPDQFPGLDGLNSAPPIPDDLPNMP